MAALVKSLRIATAINNAGKLLTNLSLSANNPQALLRGAPSTSLCNIHWTGSCPAAASIHTTATRSSLMEFFDDEKNWGKNEVKSGRSWKKEELRIKSNEDLHKLWYVLLKERNMLLTMEEHYKREYEIFPNPERIDKIADSMENLETVVRERNQAYHLLETGETGERPKKKVYNQLGLRQTYRMRQYNIPQFMNSRWHRKHKFSYGGYAVHKFLKLYREKLFVAKRRARNHDKLHALALIRNFPNMDMDALKMKFPKMNVEKLKALDKSRGHYEPK